MVSARSRGWRTRGAIAAALGALLTACAGGGRARPEPGAAPGELLGRRWRWVLTVDALGSSSPPEPARYTLELLAGGAARVRADCNEAHGTYTAAARAFAVGPLATTNAACAPDTLAPRYLEGLSAIRSVARVAGLLRADLLADAGTMWFAEEDDARLARYGCAGARRLDAVYTRGRVRLLSGGDVLDLREAESGSTLRYRAGETSWYARGDLATLERAGETVLAECRVAP
jgi:heat shock protein HslJ/membrane-bound inhibitor of C-type lysozyme